MLAGELHRQFRALPFADVGTITGPGTTLILAPHADDESLGCGGLIASCCAQGRPPVVVVATDGTGSHPESPSYPAERLRTLREQEAAAATAILGLPPGRLHFMRQPDTRAPHEGPAFEAAVDTLCTLASAHGCTAIAGPWLHDPHCDHVAAQHMARTVSRRAGIRLLSYPVWGWTLPDDLALPEAQAAGWRLDIVAHLPAKRRAIAAHASQHGGLITDDPQAFSLPAELLAAFDQPFEVFLA